MRVRIMSDLHIDVNRNDFVLEDKDTFTLIAGDIAGDVNLIKKWVRENINNGIFIEGNHCIYEGMPLQKVYEELKKEFPLKDNVSFLQNTYKIVGDYVFVGCTLWTDFRLDSWGYYSQKTASKGMNDYRYGLYVGEDGKIRKLKTTDTIEEFRKSIKFINSTCKAFPNKNLVLITHHCPSIKCSDERFINNMLNPAFISNLEPFIIAHPNIKYWICGHCHRPSLVEEIGQCKLIMNTRGYQIFGECKGFDKNFYMDI